MCRNFIASSLRPVDHPLQERRRQTQRRGPSALAGTWGLPQSALHRLSGFTSKQEACPLATSANFAGTLFFFVFSEARSPGGRFSGPGVLPFALGLRRRPTLQTRGPGPARVPRLLQHPGPCLRLHSRGRRAAGHLPQTAAPNRWGRLLTLWHIFLPSRTPFM